MLNKSLLYVIPFLMRRLYNIWAMKKLKICIVGCGRILPMHAVSVKVSNYAELAAVCDVKEDRLKAAMQEYDCRGYLDYEEMFEKERPDAVHLCVPHYLHPIIAKAAILRGINVLSEKPMAINYKYGEECVRLAEEKGVKYGVIFQCRYNDASVLVKNALTSGKLGKILSARSTLTWSRPDDYYLSSDWKGTWDKEGGGVIIDQAIHSMDLVNWFVSSEPIRVSASIANRGHKSFSVEDSAEGLIDYKNGVRYGFYCMNNYACDEPIEIRLFCEKGKATLSYEEGTIRYNDGTVEHVVQSAPTVEYKNGKDYWGFQHGKQIEQFYRAVLGLEELEISGKEALKIQKLVCAVYESGKTGKAIEF